MIALVADKDALEIMETDDAKAVTLKLTWERAAELQAALSAALTSHKRSMDELAAS